MTKEQMMDELAMSRGLEDEIVIWFYLLCEDKSISHGTLESVFIAALAMGM